MLEGEGEDNIVFFPFTTWILGFMAFENETIFILKANISPAFKMLAFENQYRLANNVGNGQAEHLIMIEFVEHFSFVFM
jgi:hypothetical protein